MRSIPELLEIIERAHRLREALMPESSEWHVASDQIAELLEEMKCRTSVAVGNAFAATLMGLSQRDLDVEVATGDRLLVELRKRGLAVFPKSLVPSA